MDNQKVINKKIDMYRYEKKFIMINYYNYI